MSDYYCIFDKERKCDADCTAWQSRDPYCIILNSQLKLTEALPDLLYLLESIRDNISQEQ